MKTKFRVVVRLKGRIKVDCPTDSAREVRGLIRDILRADWLAGSTIKVYRNKGV